MEKENTRSQQGSSSGAATASELSEIENEKENMFPSAKKLELFPILLLNPRRQLSRKTFQMDKNQYL